MILDTFGNDIAVSLAGHKRRNADALDSVAGKMRKGRKRNIVEADGTANRFECTASCQRNRLRDDLLPFVRGTDNLFNLRLGKIQAFNQRKLRHPFGAVRRQSQQFNVFTKPVGFVSLGNTKDKSIAVFTVL